VCVCVCVCVLVCDWPHSVFGQNHLFVKMLLSRIPLFRVMSEDSTRFSRQKFFFSESAIRTIVPSRSDAHLSTVPSVRTTCHTVRMPVKPSIIRPDDVHFPSGPLRYRELLFHPVSVRTPLSDRSASDSFQI
jgi:hypothetical protein